MNGDDIIKDDGMCNESEVVSVVKTTMLPEIVELRTSIELLRRDVQHLIENSSKDVSINSKDIEAIKVELKTLQHTIYGNGDDGLKTQMSHLNKWVENRVWFERVILGALGVQVVALAVLVIQHILASQ
jgi:hypothetical protein